MRKATVFAVVALGGLALVGCKPDDTTPTTAPAATPTTAPAAAATAAVSGAVDQAKTDAAAAADKAKAEADKAKAEVDKAKDNAASTIGGLVNQAKATTQPDSNK